MRGLLLILLVVLLSSDQAFGVDESGYEHEVKTKVGTLRVTKDEEKSLSIVTLNGKKVFEYVGFGINVFDPIEVGGKELILIYMNSGGIACPGEFAVLEATIPYRISKDFGNCNEEFETKVKGNTLEISMPRYIPHPDLMSNSAYRKESKKVDIYVWRDGKVTEHKGK